MSIKTKLKKQNKSKQLSYEDIGQMLVTIFETGYISKSKMYKMTFLKGMLSGLGGVLGATILVGLLIWMLSLFDNLPLVNRLVRNVNHTIQSQTR